MRSWGVLNMGSLLLTNYSGIFSARNLDFSPRGVEKVNRDGRQLRGRKHRPVAFLGRQSRLTCQVEKDGRFNQVLVGESVSAVVSHHRRPAGVGGAHFRWKRVELQCEQAEPADVR